MVTAKAKAKAKAKGEGGPLALNDHCDAAVGRLHDLGVRGLNNYPCCPCPCPCP